MRRVVLGVLIGFTLACGGAPPTGPMADVAKQFDSIDCTPSSTDEDRSWCFAQRAGRGTFTPPSSTAVRLGLTLTLQPGQDAKTAVLDHTGLSALFIGSSGAKIIDIQPSNDAELQDMIGVVMSIAATLKCTPYSSVLVKQDFLTFLKGQSGDLHTLTFDENGGVFQGQHVPALIEKVNDLNCGTAAYVTLETSTDGTMMVSVFPDSDASVLPQ